MTRQQLIDTVAGKLGRPKAEVDSVVEAIFATIAGALQASERVDVRGFGSFITKDKKARQGRNPRTGEIINIAAKRDAAFRPGKELTEKLAHAPSAETPA